ncbi:DUF3304 domain-containing protein [Roseateles koreensis]|uniref:DUF3304 domain-containing protein n=1 Tax=Roseateles koreensis TaxID=2987526 RepID=A0ABT5KZP3_9BURK|nr:DUF3304 domain-containing protein [Roseateles koreensis]MDC8787281.1 DUF3304 domain-containing protein [Roseateles koreensis]
MSITPIMKRLILLLWAVALSLGLTACKAKDDSANESLGVSITGINYTAEGVQSFYVNGAWAGNLPPYGGGGKTAGGIFLPRRWTPDLKVTVDWTVGHFTKPYKEYKALPINQILACCWAERTLKLTVPVQKYDEPARLQVFFLPDDKLEVWVTDLGVQHPDHPSGRPNPKDPRPHDPAEDK